MAEKAISEITAPADAVAQIYQMAIGAFREWRSSFGRHKEEENRYEQAFASHTENPEVRMPEEYEGIDTPQVLAQMNANKRGYLEGKFEGICLALTRVAGGDPMDWNIRIQKDSGVE